MLLLGAAAAFAPPAAAAVRRKAPVAVSTASPAALGREALGILAASAANGDPEVRAVAAKSWGELGNRAAIPPLKRALRDPNPDVRIAAAASLQSLGDVEGLLALMDEIKPPKSEAVTTPVAALRGMARDAARARAALQLGLSGGSSAVDALDAALGDPSGQVRDAAAIALARLGKADASQFVAAMKDPDEGMRASAARSLGLIGREGEDELEKAAASDASATVRAAAAEALGAFSDPSSLDVLTKALGDKSGRVQLAAARALARRDVPPSTAALQKLLADSPPAPIALTAEAALAARGVAVDLSLPELTLGLKDPDLKILAVETLAAAPGGKAEDLLARTMRGDPDARVRALAAAALVRRLSKKEAP
ncbi:MAG: HEAT repeat domain-containing protein [Elusimicrobia bacterium]|nr:HEAT repeat domain-containing protein [Elusimicrobiota bacterium]